jgi:hypothetical protein
MIVSLLSHAKGELLRVVEGKVNRCHDEEIYNLKAVRKDHEGFDFRELVKMMVAEGVPVR